MGFMMGTKDLASVTTALFEKMKTCGYSHSRLEDTKWFLEHFKHYCDKYAIEHITIPVAVEFVRDNFEFDYYSTTSRF